VTAYKFLAADGTAIFSRFRWPVGDWVDSDVDPCRSGIHACRLHDLPYWLGPALWEIELGGEVVAHGLKVVAARGRLTRRIESWNDETREEYSQMCIARAAELAEQAAPSLTSWAPPPSASRGGPALMGFIAARIAEQAGGLDAYIDERVRQATWLGERLALAA
jgi:hypothetical protein